MQPKIVNFKVNQHLYSLRLLLSSISYLSFFPSSLSSSQARLICIYSHFNQFLCSFLPAPQAFLLESCPFLLYKLQLLSPCHCTTSDNSVPAGWWGRDVNHPQSLGRPCLEDWQVLFLSPSGLPQHSRNLCNLGHW